MSALTVQLYLSWWWEAERFWADWWWRGGPMSEAEDRATEALRPAPPTLCISQSSGSRILLLLLVQSCVLFGFPPFFDGGLEVVKVEREATAVAYGSSMCS